MLFGFPRWVVMKQIWMLLQRNRGDVLSGKVIVDKNGNPFTGTMPDNSTRTSNGNVPGINSAYPDLATREGINLQICEDTNGTRRINMAPPKGYYNGEVYINRPASDFGNAPASAIDPDYTATSQNGLNMRGTMPTMGGQEITPATYQQTVSCNGKKMTGDVTVNPIPNYHGTDSICLGGWMNYDTGYAFFRMLNGYYEKYSNGDEPATAHTFADVAGIIGLTPDMIFKGKACLGINGTAEGYVRDNYTIIYSGGTNNDGVDFGSDNDRGTYLSFKSRTVSLIKKYNLNKCNGLRFKCNSNNTNYSSYIKLWIKNSITGEWNLVKKQPVDNSVTTATDHYCNLDDFAGAERSLKIEFYYVNITQIQFY